MLLANENTNLINRASQRNSIDNRMTYEAKDTA